MVDHPLPETIDPQCVSNHTLRRLLQEKSAEPIGIEAGKLLLLRRVNNPSLGLVMKYVPTIRHEAWKQLLRQTPTRDDLLWILCHVPELQRECWQRLPTLTNEQLCTVMADAPDLLHEAWKRCLDQSPNYYDLERVLVRVPSLREEAATLILQAYCPNTILLCILYWVPTLRAAAWQRLLEQGPTDADLQYILDCVYSLRNEAIALLRRSSL